MIRFGVPEGGCLMEFWWSRCEPLALSAHAPVPARAGSWAEAMFYLSLLGFHGACPCASLSAFHARENNPARGLGTAAFGSAEGVCS